GEVGGAGVKRLAVVAADLEVGGGGEAAGGSGKRRGNLEGADVREIRGGRQPLEQLEDLLDGPEQPAQDDPGFGEVGRGVGGRVNVVDDAHDLAQAVEAQHLAD